MRKYLFAISVLLITVSTAFAEATPELFSFSTVPATASHTRSEVTEARRININIGSIAKNQQFIQVALLDGSQQLAIRTGFEYRGSADFTWRGQFDSSISSTLVLTVHQGAVIGFIQQKEKTYLIENLPGGGEIDPGFLVESNGIFSLCY